VRLDSPFHNQVHPLYWELFRAGAHGFFSFRLWDAELLNQRIEPTIAQIGVIQVRARPSGKHDACSLPSKMNLENVGG